MVSNQMIRIKDFSNTYNCRRLYQFSLVANMSPRNVIASPDTTSILLSWLPPLNESQNGELLTYSISLTGLPFQMSNQMFSSNSTASYPSNDLNTLSVLGLEEYNNYTITVSAVNSVGQGPPSSPIEVVTLEAGEFLNFCLEFTLSSYFHVFGACFM